MELIYLDGFLKSNEKLNICGSISSTIGMFDGFHLGHKELIKKLLSVAKEKGEKSSVITFDIHPDFILNKRENSGYLLSFKDKVKMIEAFNIDYLFVFTFNKEFSSLTHTEFEDVLERLNINTLVIGKDTKYGYKGLGSANTLKEKFDVYVLDDYYKDNILVHSKVIRDYLKDGLVEKANRLLGYNFFIKGVVSHGRQIGRTYNVKTANIDLDDQYNYLLNGVYGVVVILDGKKYTGICNIGNNPSFNYTKTKKLEVNIFDFNQDIYGVELCVELVTFIRREMVFSSKEELKKQIEIDTLKYEKYLKERIWDLQ